MSGRKVAVFGAGIAGLTAAHELARRGYAVEVFEAQDAAGGFFRSARLAENGNTPSEYSWHGLGPWYHNAFDLLRQIPFDERGSVFARALSRPIDFGIFPNRGRAHFYGRSIRSLRLMFEMSRWDWCCWAWLMLKTWAARRRTEVAYAAQNAADEWGRFLSKRSYITWRSCFGPWIGSDWTNCSLHTAGQFFRKQLISWPSHWHAADEHGPGWSHGQGDGWLLFRGPSSEFWFDRWLRDLESRGVRLFRLASLHRLNFDGTRVQSATLADGREVQADSYIMAIDPFAAAKVVERSPGLAAERELRKFRPLIQGGPHTQVSFRLAFAEPIRFPRKRTAVVLADSEFNLTLFAEDQVWNQNVELGDGVQSLWTGTSCVGTVPGRIYGLPVVHCTREQFLEEVEEQILRCQALDALVREANGGRSLRSFRILKTEVWHEWHFDPAGIHQKYPKWVNSTRTQPYQPEQVTTIPNLLLAGAHTRTEVDVWSIEGAVESGRRAARAIDDSIDVIPQYKPAWLRLLSRLDDICYQAGAPHFLDAAAVAGGLAALGLAVFGAKAVMNRLARERRATRERPLSHGREPRPRLVVARRACS
jgi:hypothetical protein